MMHLWKLSEKQLRNVVGAEHRKMFLCLKKQRAIINYYVQVIIKIHNYCISSAAGNRKVIIMHLRSYSYVIFSKITKTDLWPKDKQSSGIPQCSRTGKHTDFLFVLGAPSLKSDLTEDDNIRPGWAAELIRAGPTCSSSSRCHSVGSGTVRTPGNTNYENERFKKFIESYVI
jgi:hypothetical protein